MKTELKEISTSQREMIIVLEADEALVDYQKVLLNIKKKVTIPGFRKGKAPLSSVERDYGEYAKEEYFDKYIDVYYKKALENLEISPVNPGKMQEIDWENGKELKATFRFEVLPKIEIKKYKGLKIPFEPLEFNTEMVDEYILKIQRENQYLEDTSEPAAVGNEIDIDIIFLDENGNLTSKEIEKKFILGDSIYCEEFDKNMIGANIDDEIRTILFTEKNKMDNEFDNSMINKEFLVRVNNISEIITPELDDDFAKDVDFETMEIMRKHITEDIKMNLEKQNNENTRQSILDVLIKENPLELPSSMVERYAKELLEPYAKSYNADEKKILPVYMKIAEHNLLIHYIIEEIIKIENIEVTEQDKAETIKTAASNLNMEIEEYKEMYKKIIESEDFIYSIEEKKIFDLIKESSEFVPYPEDEKNIATEEDVSEPVLSEMNN